MIKSVEIIGQLIDISTHLMRCCLLKGIFHHCAKPCNLQHQCLLGFTDCLLQNRFLQAAALLLILIQNRFDPDNRIKDVGTCVSLEGGKLVNIKDIILGCLIGKITILDR